MKQAALAVLFALAMFVAATGCRTMHANQGAMGSGSIDRGSVEAMLASWPETATKAARESMDKYGMPNEATPTMLVWHDNGPWKRSIVYKEEIQHDFPMPHKDVWEQFIDYRVPAAMFDDLAMYDGSVIVERTKGEISARCDKEGANFLAINLANDIVTGKRSVEDARMMYAETMKAVMRGEMPQYVRGFIFSLPTGNTDDPDRSMMSR